MKWKQRQRRHPLVRRMLRMAERASLKRGAIRFAVFVSCGIPMRGWWRVLRENRFRVDLRYWPLVILAQVTSLINTINAARERRLYGAQIDATEVEAPIFILGHWRSGTTLLHELLCLDERHAFPSFYQVLRPYTYLTEEAAALKHLGELVPRKRPMDSMELGINTPAEDEWTLTQYTLLSPQVGWFFPLNAKHYDRYLNFEGVPQSEVDVWKDGMLRSIRKLTFRHQKRLVLKSPAHTGRIEQILELYPKARFLHIHRNPYHVYRSTERLYHSGIAVMHLQRVDDETITESILRRYRMMYEGYFRTRELVPKGQLCEVSFEELEADKYGQTKRIYEELGLGGFEDIEPALQDYLGAVAAYRKNVYPPLPEDIRARVAQEWGPCFDEWGYVK